MSEIDSGKHREYIRTWKGMKSDVGKIQSKTKVKLIYP